MTHDEHKARHLMLHNALDELLADYILGLGPLGYEGGFLDTPVKTLMEWSFRQTLSPTGLEHEEREIGDLGIQEGD